MESHHRIQELKIPVPSVFTNLQVEVLHLVAKIGYKSVTVSKNNQKS